MSDVSANATPAPVSTPAESAAPAVEATSSPSQSPAPSQSEGQAAIAEAVANGATAAEVKAIAKEYKLKVNGKEIIKKYNSDDDLIRDLQLGLANQGGMSKARELEKLYEKEIKRLQESPWEVLQELGHDPLKLSEKKLQEWVEEQKKSPEQVEFEKMQRELHATREELKRQKQEAESARMQQLEKQATQQIMDDITNTLKEHKTLPNSKKTVSRIADALIWASENGFPNATVKDVIPMVEQDIKDEMQGFVSDMPEELMEQYFGAKNIERMRKKRVAQMKAATNAAQTQEVTRPAPKPEESQKISMRDFFKNPEKYQK